MSFMWRKSGTKKLYNLPKEDVVPETPPRASLEEVFKTPPPLSGKLWADTVPDTSYDSSEDAQFWKTRSERRSSKDKDKDKHKHKKKHSKRTGSSSPPPKSKKTVSDKVFTQPHTGTPMLTDG